jgi:ribonuclease-3
MKKLSQLEERLGYKFKNIDLLTEALTHKSFKGAKNNERLEFLGDAV